jgi:hypothetical protein
MWFLVDTNFSFLSLFFSNWIMTYSYRGCKYIYLFYLGFLYLFCYFYHYCITYYFHFFLLFFHHHLLDSSSKHVTLPYVICRISTFQFIFLYELRESECSCVQDHWFYLFIFIMVLCFPLLILFTKFFILGIIIFISQCTKFFFCYFVVSNILLTSIVYGFRENGYKTSWKFWLGKVQT